MDIGEIAKKVDALEAELAARSSRIADLEARVSFLEADNARLRKVVREGEGRSKEGFAGNKQKPIDMFGEQAVDDVTEVSDGEEEGMAVDVNKGESAEEGVPTVPTPVKCAERVATGQKSDDEVEIVDAEGGGGGDHVGVCCDAHVDLEDDDVSATPRGKNRVASRVISDSEDEDEKHGKEEVGVTSSRKRALRAVSDSESKDDSESESQEHATGIESEDADGDLCEMEGCSIPGSRPSARSVKSRPNRMRPARRELEFVEPKDHEESEDDSEEDDSMDGFIDDADCTENSDDSSEEYSAELEECDNEYEDVMDRIRGKKNAKNEEWEYEGDMLSAFAKQPELCLKAVCSLYRKQTEEEKAQRSTIVHNKKGFSQIDAPRGSRIAQFLLDGDASGPLKKTTQDLKKYDRFGLEFCRKMAFRYSKQLFGIYKNREDPYFP